MAPLASRNGWTLMTTGIGAAAVEQALSADPRTGPVLLAGVAGALTADLAPGTAHLIAEVFTPGGVLHSPLIAEGLRVTGADEIIATPRDKAALAARTGGQGVDMESHAFAVAAEAAGRPWAIILDGPLRLSLPSSTSYCTQTPVSTASIPSSWEYMGS